MSNVEVSTTPTLAVVVAASSDVEVLRENAHWVRDSGVHSGMKTTRAVAALGRATILDRAKLDALCNKWDLASALEEANTDHGDELRELLAGEDTLPPTETSDKHPPPPTHEKTE